MEVAEHKLVATARAIGVKPGTIRTWLNRSQVILNNQSGQAWGRILLTDGDVLFCTLVAELSKYGVPVDQAFRMVRAVGDQVTAEMAAGADFISEMLEQTIVFWNDGGAWNWTAKLDAEAFLRPSLLILAVGSCAYPVFEKLWPGHSLPE